MPRIEAARAINVPEGDSYFPMADVTTFGSPACSIEDILTTEELLRRPSRAPDYESENKALIALATCLALSPETVLQKLVAAALALTGAESSGLSISEQDGQNDVFRWHAVAGDFDRYLGGTMPRNFSPCGTVFERNTALLMNDPAKFYPCIAGLHRPIRELLLVPFYRGDRLIGTVWVIAHTDGKMFDAEDRRVVTSLAQFASMATKTLADLQTLEVTGRDLARARIRLTAALEAGAIGTWTWDVEKDRVDADSRLLALFGLPLEDGEGAPLSRYVDAIHPDDRERVSAAINHAMESGEPYEAEYRTMPSETTIRWIVARGRATRNATGSIVELCGIFLDITERKLAEIRDHEADRRKTEFLATLAHELRNPLAPIRNGLEILKATELAGAGRQARAIMERQVLHLVRLIDDLMDVSRIASGKMELRKMRVELRSVIDSAIEASQPAIAAANHELCVNVPQNGAQLDADPVRLAQIFSNLFINAAKYTPAGGRIEISREMEASAVVVRVIDNGIGIASDKLERVFDMFGQVGQAIERAQGGLGIGLSLSQTIVEMHGGSIYATSAGQGRGSTFVVRLPLPPPGDDERSETATAQAMPGREQSSSRVLIIEDNVDGAESLAMLLGLTGHRVSVAHSGGEGIVAAFRDRPDIVLLDIGLPDMTGYEVARRLRADRSLDATVLVAMTGWGSQEDKEKAALSGFDHHLTKPVAPADLEKLLAGTLNRH